MLESEKTQAHVQYKAFVQGTDSSQAQDKDLTVPMLMSKKQFPSLSPDLLPLLLSIIIHRTVFIVIIIYIVRCTRLARVRERMRTIEMFSFGTR